MTTLLQNTLTSDNQVSNSKITQQTSIKLLFIIIGLSFVLRLFYYVSTDLLVEEAYYWNYAKHLDIGYLDHPPMVAYLIKIFTSVFGTYEFGVRFASLLCWLTAAFFSFKLTNLFARGTGQYAVMLIAVLPFFFMLSLIMTPDIPLTACWSASLYYLYRSLILEESRSWYMSGVWIGLGLLSKYTIVLLGPAALLFMCIVPEARKWLTRKEPYLCLLIAIIFFTPVIYWNATHEWISFVFQSTRRVHAPFRFSFHHFLGLLLMFLMPTGVFGLWTLFNQKSSGIQIPKIELRFFQVFTIVPLLVFGSFSLTHAIKFDWIGPALLSVIPWLAASIPQSKNNRNSWFITAVLLLFCEASALLSIVSGMPNIAQTTALVTFINWSGLTQQINMIAKQVESDSGEIPIIIPLDLYNIQSELAFYQEKLLEHGEIQKIYPTLGRHIFGEDSLMYRYWADNTPLTGKTVILISRESIELSHSSIKGKFIEKSPMNIIWAKNQAQTTSVSPFYYQIGQMK